MPDIGYMVSDVISSCYRRGHFDNLVGDWISLDIVKEKETMIKAQIAPGFLAMRLLLVQTAVTINC